MLADSNVGMGIYYRLHDQGVVLRCVDLIMLQRQPRKLLIRNLVDKVFDALLDTRRHREWCLEATSRFVSLSLIYIAFEGYRLSSEFGDLRIMEVRMPPEYNGCLLSELMSGLRSNRQYVGVPRL